MKIAIRKENEQKIEAALLNRPVSVSIKALKGRVKSFAIYSYDEVAQAVELAESKLARFGLAKKHTIGVRYTKKPSCHNSSYRLTVTGTSITIERFKTGWFLIDVKDIVMWPGDKGRDFVYFPSPRGKDDLRRIAHMIGFDFATLTPTTNKKPGENHEHQ